VVDAYKAMTADLISKWNTQLKDLYISKYEGVNVRSSDVFTNYLYPQVSGNGTLVALKSGLSDIETFVELDNSGDQKLFQVGVFNDPGFLSIGNNLLVWTEFEVDPRWGKRSFSVVKTFDLSTGQHSTISTKTRYSGATVSPDDSKIAVINNFSDGRVQIQLISSMGNTLQEFGSPSHTFYSMLRWSADGKFLTALKHRPSEKAIVKIDVENGEEEILMDYSSENRGHPVMHGDYLFYNSPYSGIDNIYAVNLSSRETFQVTSSKYGSFNPVISHDGKMIYYNDFKVNGMDVVKIHFEPLSWTPLHKITPHVIDYYKSTVEQENNGNILNSIPDTIYIVKPYKKSSQLFNIHSWGPYFATSALNYEIGVIFQDVLSQNAGFAGYDWNVDENTGKWKLEYTYEGFYPAIDIHASTGTRKAVQNLGDTLNIKYDWNETGITTGLRVPLNLTKSKFSTKISFGDHIGYNRVSNFTNTVDDMRYSYSLQANGDLISNSFSFSLTNFLKRPKRNIRSRWGQTLFLDWSSTPFGGDYDAGITSITSQLYFPGFFKHHSINFLGAFQSRKITLNPNNYLFSNNVPYPRGYNSSSWESFRTLRSNYEMTLWNADLAIGPVLNIQRIRLKLFYDTGFGQTDVINSDTNLRVQSTRDYQSFGSEIWFDFNFMRLLPLLSGGIRTVYTSESGWRAEIVIGNIQI